MPKTNVYSHEEFEKLCQENEWNDQNVESLEDKAFISITCSETSKEGMFVYKTRREHYFKANHPNVLNIEFDDVENDLEWELSSLNKKGCYKALNEPQSYILYKFIKNNLGKDFYIHCSAGVSRSQGVGMFIRECFPDFKYTEREDNPCLTPNNKVVQMLKRKYYEDYGFYYED